MRYDSTFCIAVIRLRVWGSGFRIQAGGRYFSSCRPCRPLYLSWGPTSILFSGYRGYFPGFKRQGPQVHHSCPSGAEVENEWSCISASLCAFTVWKGAICSYYSMTLCLLKVRVASFSEITSHIYFMNNLKYLIAFFWIIPIISWHRTKIHGFVIWLHASDKLNMITAPQTVQVPYCPRLAYFNVSQKKKVFWDTIL